MVTSRVQEDTITTLSTKQQYIYSRHIDKLVKYQIMARIHMTKLKLPINHYIVPSPEPEEP